LSAATPAVGVDLLQIYRMVSDTSDALDHGLERVRSGLGALSA
jgi:hypothetical protein